MITDELRELLIEKKKDLIKELNAINVLLGEDEIVLSDFSNNVKNLLIIEESDEVPKFNVSAKSNNETWKDYIYKIANLLKYNIKTNQIADVILKSNKNVTPARAKQVSADKILELVNEGKVKVYKGVSKKEGYTYEVIE